MGEIADMMLDGTLCEQCGDYLGSGNDFPTICKSCEEELKREKRKNKAKKVSRKDALKRS